jgi:hypothetical protein
MIQLAEVAKKIRKPNTTLSYMARTGVFKTAHKEFIDHCDKWFVEEDEANEFIKNYLIHFNFKLI